MHQNSSSTNNNMETVNNIAQAAAKAVWGDNTTNGKEPISGAQGDPSKGEPFDKGNLEEPQTPDLTNGGTKDVDFAKSTGTAATGESGQDKKTDTSATTNDSAALKEKDTPADTSAGQNDVREPENPQTHPGNAPTDVDDTGDGPNEAQELDGPGPKPLGEVARENGGDAGKANSASASKSGDELLNGGEADGASKPEDSGSNDPADPHAKSTGEGTGEKYIKTTGVAADGGDFDATKAGAGREADRLLEEKGVHVSKGAGPKGNSDTSVNSNGSDKEKRSLKDKIKDKLHRH